MPRELELKMDLDIAAMRQISEWLLKRRKTTGVTQQLRTVYFDTNDFALRRSGISLRVRKAADNYLQTIKLAESGGAGYFDRPEWETKVSGFHPDLAAARRTGLKPFRIKHLSKLIATAFEIRARRTTYAISDGGARLELALDEGRILGKGRGARFCELEIEVKQGKRDDLFRVARAIGRVAPLRLGFRTKADRGYAAIHGNENGVFRAEKIDLRPKTRAEAAFRLIARDCLRQLVANVPATLEGNAEALHQMRVSIRRLRAGMSVFSELIRDRDLGKLKAEFRWISRILGNARDLERPVGRNIEAEAKWHPKTGFAGYRARFSSATGRGVQRCE